MLTTRAGRRFAGASLLFSTLLVALSAAAQRPLFAQDGGWIEQKRTEDEQKIARAIARVYPSLVQVHVLVVECEGGRERKFQAAGSGAVFQSEGGAVYVVTNHHVAGKATAIRVILSSKEELDAVRVGTDALADIAVLKLDLSSRRPGAPAIPSAKFGSSDALKNGDPILAMGCPLALSHSVTRGIVANKDMMMPKAFEDFFQFKLDGEDVGSVVKWIGHDAQIFPGNSGGPLVNMEGEIVGINEIGMGLSGAIPSDLAKQVCQELIAYGHARRSWIGADFQPLLKTTPGSWGVLVGGVIPGSPAETAGLRAGDVVLSLNGNPVQARFREELPAFNVLMLSQPVGSKLDFLVERGKEHVVVSVKSELRDDAEGKEREAKEWGLSVREVTTMTAKEMQRKDKKGVLVSGVRSGGPCDQATPAIVANDVIVEIGGKPVESLDGFLAATREICAGRDAPVPTIVAFERKAERVLTLVEVGVRALPDPTSEAKKPWLAVATQVLSKKLAKALGLKGKKGVIVSMVYPESNAEEAGLRLGDVITQLDGQPIEASEPQDSEVFSEMIRSRKIGTKAELTVYRGGEATKLTATLGEAPKPERELKVIEDVRLELKARDISYLDRVKNRWSKDESGALVSDVESGGWAAVGHLHVDDLVKEIDGAPVTNVKELEAGLKKAAADHPRHTALLVRRGIHTLFVEIEPTAAEKPEKAEKK